MTTVVNKRLKSYDVYIGRSPGPRGVFGNPYVIGRDGTREEVLEKFRKYFLHRVDVDDDFRVQVLALRGKTLGCFCKPEACHGDVIAQWVDGQPESVF